MSQLELTRTLRAARPVAPAELRERVLLVAAGAAPPHHRVTWRRALVIAVPVAAALVAGILVARPTHQNATQHGAPTHLEKAITSGAAATDLQGAYRNPGTAPSRTRFQNYSAALELRLRDAAAVSDTTKRAVAIAHALGGYELRVNVDTARANGYATLRLRVPKLRVQDAVRRLTALGTVVSEDVSVQDLQAQVNATDRLIVRLQDRLAHAQTSAQIATLQSRIDKLQRGRAATVRTAHYATVDLRLTTATPAVVKPAGHGPLHGLGVAFRWIGIGAVYALALGLPLVLLGVAIWLAVRALRRRSEDALLSRT